MCCLHRSKMAMIVHQPEHRRKVSMCCVFHCWNKVESFSPAGTHHIRMIHSLGVWSESCSSLQFYPVHIISANALNNCSEIRSHILIEAQISLWLTKSLIKANKCVCISANVNEREWMMMIMWVVLYREVEGHWNDHFYSDDHTSGFAFSLVSRNCCT